MKAACPQLELNGELNYLLHFALLSLKLFGHACVRVVVMIFPKIGADNNQTIAKMDSGQPTDINTR